MAEESPKPPDATEIIARAKGGGRVAPGSRSAMAHGDPVAVYRRYEQAADPQWEQFGGAPPADVMGAIDLAGEEHLSAAQRRAGGIPETPGENLFGDMLRAGPYEAIAFETGYGMTVGEYFEDEADKFYRSGKRAPTIISSVGHEAAPLTYIPTSTTNPERPRTVAAGWDRDRNVLTVMFRDGTFYNYYGVSGLEWSNFVSARSKGRFIKAYLDAKVRGFADTGSVPEAHQRLLYKAARTAQVMRGGYTGKQKVGTKRGTGGKYRYGASGTSTSGGRSYGRTTGRYLSSKK